MTPSILLQFLRCWEHNDEGIKVKLAFPKFLVIKVQIVVLLYNLKNPK